MTPRKLQVPLFALCDDVIVLLDAFASVNHGRAEYDQPDDGDKGCDQAGGKFGFAVV